MTTESLQKATVANFLLFLIVGLAISAWAPMVPYVKERLQLDEATLGLTLLAFGIGALVAMPIAGWLVQRFGCQPIICSVTPIAVCLLPALAIAPTNFILGILLFCFGAGSGFLNIAINAHAVELQKRLQRPIMSRFHCLFSFGGLLGAGAISCLLQGGCTLFISTLCLSSGLLLLTLRGCRCLLVTATDDTPVSRTVFSLPDERILMLGALCFIFFMVEGAMLDWSGVFLQLTCGYKEALAGLGYAAFSVAMSLGRYTGDHLVERLGPHNILRMGAFLAASGLLISVTGFNGLELVGFFLVGMGAANVVPVLFSASDGGRALAVMTTMGYTGLLLGPVAIGFIAQGTSLSFAFLCCALILLTVGFAARAIRLSPERV